jgi:hypothetical protein
MKPVTRTLGQAVTAAAVAVTILLGGLGTGIADATPQKPHTVPDFDSVDQFKSFCESSGGEVIGAENVRSHGCYYKDGTFVHCENAGKVCTEYSPKRIGPDGDVPRLVDDTGLGATDTTSGGKKGGPEGKKDNKGRK